MLMKTSSENTASLTTISSYRVGRWVRCTQ
jgi:hypothetical protein